MRHKWRKAGGLESGDFVIHDDTHHIVVQATHLAAGRVRLVTEPVNGGHTERTVTHPLRFWPVRVRR